MNGTPLCSLLSCFAFEQLKVQDDRLQRLIGLVATDALAALKNKQLARFDGFVSDFGCERRATILPLTYEQALREAEGVDPASLGKLQVGENLRYFIQAFCLRLTKGFFPDGRGKTVPSKLKDYDKKYRHGERLNGMIELMGADYRQASLDRLQSLTGRSITDPSQKGPSAIEGIRIFFEVMQSKGIAFAVRERTSKETAFFRNDQRGAPLKGEIITVMTGDAKSDSFEHVMGEFVQRSIIQSLLREAVLEMTEQKDKLQFQLFHFYASTPEEEGLL